MRLAALAAVCLLAAAQQTTPPWLSGDDSDYVDTAACRTCHPKVAAAYAQTGMARSFYPASEIPTGSYYHQASNRHYRVYERDGRYYQRRHQLDAQGREINVVEKEIHYVLGSGNHARTYLHRAPSGQLLQLPVGWYAEEGGHWAMNPGYDRPDHMDFRRKIDRECYFCHNAYPRTAALPQGIDCQRCHGPGRQHVALAQQAASPKAIAAAIVNPAKLSPQRSMEVCLQCHLQSSSHRLPYAIRNYSRGYFSYKPGEPLGDYITHFDKPQDTFEIAHSAYRLMQSPCYQKGKLTCTTCHDPHKPAQAQANHNQTCRTCHTKGQHMRQPDCIQCHMPKRRTTDAVHVRMTDHRIARRPATQTAAVKEVHDTDANTYKGPVARLYPPSATPTLYDRLAQVIEGGNLQAGIPLLEKAIISQRPANAEFYFELGIAYLRAGQAAKALPWFQQGMERDPKAITPRLYYATALGNNAAAMAVLESTPTEDAAILNMLGTAYLNAGHIDKAIATLQKAAKLDPDLPEPYVNLGVALAKANRRQEAIEALKEAIRLAPDLTAAQQNLNALQR